MVNENLLYNPSFTEGTTGWTAYTSTGSNPTLSQITPDSFSNNTCLKITKTSSTADQGVLSATAYKAVATVGEVYSASARVRVPTGQESIDVRVSIRWYDSSKAYLSGSAGALITVVDRHGWVYIKTENQTAPSSTAYADVIVYQDSGGKTIGNYFLVDQIKLENSSTATAFALNQGQETAAVNTALKPLSFGDPNTRPYITGLKLQGDVVINDLTLNTIDETGVVWVCTDITGWWTLPTPEVPNIARGLDDGAYDVRGRWLPRDITLTGSILPPDPDAAPAARKRLLEALDLVYTGGWLKVDEDPIKTCYVRVVGQPQITSVNARGRMDFSVQLRAGDPIKYSWETATTDGYSTSSIAINTTNGSMTNTTITNSGNTNTAPVFSITGPMTAPAYIKNITTGKTIKIVKNLRSSSFTIATTRKVSTSGIVTLTTSGEHGFMVGDVVTVASIDTHTFLNGTKTITATTDTSVTFLDTGVTVTSAILSSNVVTLTTATSHGFSTGNVCVVGLGMPYDGTYPIASASGTSITYSKVYADTARKYEGTVYLDISSSVDTASVTLASADTLEIDTYNTTVLYRGLPDAARSTLDAGVDWIKLQPGDNSLRLEKSNSSVTPASMTIKYKSGWIS